MRQLIIIAIATFVLCVATTNSAQAERTRGNRKHAATSELPSALAALNLDETRILTESQAENVRGQWLLNLRLPLGAIYFQSHGRFDLQVLTIGHGVNPGKPIRIWLQIGR